MSDTLKVWMNGELMPADEVRVSPFDLGLAVGWGAFETMPGYDGKVFGLARHYDRLKHSASVMEIHVPSMELIQEAIDAVVQANDLGSGRTRIRVSLSGGSYSLFGGGDAKDARGNVMVNVVAVDDPAGQVKLIVSPFTHNERSGLSGCKSSSYGNNLMVLRRAVAEGVDEAVMLNTVGQVCECATANIFVVKDGVVKTPSLSSGCLAGVTRAVVLELAGENEIGVEECELTVEDVADADEIFLTSSAREVQSAVMLDDVETKVGSVTARLSELYQQRVREELGL